MSKKNKSVCISSQPSLFPEFVRLISKDGKYSVALRKTGNSYFRDYGCWTIGARLDRKTGKLTAIVKKCRSRSLYEKANNCEIVKTTGSYWAKDNNVNWRDWKRVGELESIISGLQTKIDSAESELYKLQDRIWR